MLFSFPARVRSYSRQKVIAPFYLCWVLPTVVFYYFPVPEGISSFQQNLILFLFVAMYLLLASSLTYRIIKFVLLKDRAEVFIYSAVALFLFLLIYGYARIYDYSAVLIAGLSTANLLFAAGIAGTVLSSAIKRTGELVPVCLTAATADLMSVIKGPTKGMIEDISAYYEQGMIGPPPFVDFIVVKAGIPGYDVPLPLFGVTDWVLVALLSASLLRLNKTDNLLPGVRLAQERFLYLPVSAFALFAGLVTAQITGLFLPAMVFIVLFFLAYLVIKLKVHRELERSDVLYSFLLPSCIVVVILLI